MTEEVMRLPDRNSIWHWGDTGELRKVKTCIFGEDEWHVVVTLVFNLFDKMTLDEFWAKAKPYSGTREDHSGEISPQQYKRKYRTDA